MPKPINYKCLECSRLAFEEAIALHGEAGDGCWNPAICHRKRSHYRKREEINARQRGNRAANHKLAELIQLADESPAKLRSVTERIEVQIKAPAFALLYLYREPRQDAHLHAIAITVWQGNEKLAVIQPKHCIGMSNRHVRQYLEETLKILKEKYGISEFEPEILLPPSECPINPCPSKGL